MATEENDKGKLFIRRVQEALKEDNETTTEELQEKVDELKDLMITLVKMLKHATQKIHNLQSENDIMASENAEMVDLIQEMENYMNQDGRSSKFGENDDLKSTSVKVKSEDSSIKAKLGSILGGSDSKLNSTISNHSTVKRKSKMTQTIRNDAVKEALLKLESGMIEAMFKPSSKNKLNIEEVDWPLHKLQKVLMRKEQTWHQTSGREREQRIKLLRMIKEMTVLHKQLEWKTSQLAYKDSELVDKTKMLNSAERKINELQKTIRSLKKKVVAPSSQSLTSEVSHKVYAID